MANKGVTTVHRSMVVVFLVTSFGFALFIGKDFLEILLLAAITAGLARRLMEWLETHSVNRTVAAVITTLLAMLFLVVPVSGLITAAIFGMTRFVENELSGRGTSAQEVLGRIADLPVIRDFDFRSIAESERFLQALQGGGSDVIEGVARTLGLVGRGALLGIVFVLALYYFLLDRKRIRRAMESAIPLERDQKRRILAQFVSVTRATLKGTVVMGIIQGALGGFLFWILGLPSPLAFSVVFATLATIPNVGAILVWLPTAVVLAFMGDWGRAAIMAIGGGVVIAATDYLVRPRLIGQDTALHPLLVLIGILGGLSIFGLSGLIIGPIVMAVFVQSWVVFSETFGKDLSEISE